MSTYLRDIESNSDFLAQPKYGVDFGSKEARIAAAIVAAGIGSGGGGGGSSTDIGQETEAGINSATDGSLLARLRGIQEILESQPVTQLIDSAQAVTTSSSEIFAANSDNIEIFIQNKSTTTEVYVRANGAPTANLSTTIYPRGSITLTGLDAQAQTFAIAESGSVNIYIKIGRK